jgi:hypothetical protein
MRFSKQITYSAHDSHHYQKGGRHIILNGVPARCQEIITMLQQQGDYMGACDFTRHGSSGHKDSDYAYAAMRLVSVGVLTKSGALYSLVKGGAAKWKQVLRATTR